MYNTLLTSLRTICGKENKGRGEVVDGDCRHHDECLHAVSLKEDLICKNMHRDQIVFQREERLICSNVVAKQYTAITVLLFPLASCTVELSSKLCGAILVKEPEFRPRCTFISFIR